MADALELLDEPRQLHLALSPVRRRILDHLREPGSATQLAAVLGLSRQRVNYHVRVLEDAGLLELVEERPRRGCVERILRTRAQALVVDPAVLGLPAAPLPQDRSAAAHLVAAASGVVRDVTRMQSEAAGAGTRLLTFTIETDVRLAEPADLDRLTDALAEAVAGVVVRFHTPRRGRRYRVVVGGHPMPRPTPGSARAARPPRRNVT